ncbi:MAG: Rib/alpha-like domain-containing protein [Corynebacterium sp.]|nr:Rib/alpha-like domain-containing protein [Corynebacterium sp.]
MRIRNHSSLAMAGLGFFDRTRTLIAGVAAGAVIATAAVAPQALPQADAATVVLDDPNDQAALSELEKLQAGAEESTGTMRGVKTVSGIAVIDGDGSAMDQGNWDTILDGTQKGLENLKVYAYYIDKDGAQSPTYYTTIQKPDKLNQNWSIQFKDFKDAAGTTHTFEAIPGEKIKVWVDGFDKQAYTVSYNESNPYNTSTARQFSAWNLAAGSQHVYNHFLVLQRTPQWEGEPGTAVPLTLATDQWVVAADNMNQKSPHVVSGTVFWDNHTGNARADYALPNFAAGDMPAEQIQVVGSYLRDEVVALLEAWKREGNNATAPVEKQISEQSRIIKEWEAANPGQSAIAETVYTYTNDNGEYQLKFRGIWGDSWSYKGISTHNHHELVAPDPATGEIPGSFLKGNENSKHINTNYMYIYPVLNYGTDGTLAAYTRYGANQAPFFQPAAESNRGDIIGGYGVNEIGYLNFPLYQASPDFNIIDFDTREHPAKPGDTARLEGKSLMVKTPYTIVWTDNNGTVINKCSFETTELGLLPDGVCDLAVPANLPRTTIYTASLYSKYVGENNDKNVLTASDSFIALAGSLGMPNGSVGDSYTGGTSQDIREGQTVVYKAEGLPEGLSINATSGTISGTPTTPGVYEVNFPNEVRNSRGKLVTTIPQKATVVITDILLDDGDTVTAYTKTIDPATTDKATDILGLPEGTLVRDLKAAGLPAGLTLTPVKGATAEVGPWEITGTPQKGGQFDVLFTYRMQLPGSEAMETHSDTVSMTITAVMGERNDPAYTATTVKQEETADSAAPTDAAGKDGFPAGTTFTFDDSVVWPNADAPWATIDPVTGVISAAPHEKNPDPGKTTLPVRVTYPDGTSDLVQAPFTIEPGDQNVLFNPEYQQGTVVKRTETETVPAPIDPSRPATEQKVPLGTTFEKVSGPDWAKVDRDNGSIKLTPDEFVELKAYTIEVIAHYPDGTSDPLSAQVVVTAGNMADEFEGKLSYTPQQVRQLETATSRIVDDIFAVPAGSEFASVNLPEWASLDPATGDITWAPGQDVEPKVYDTFQVTITFPDGTGPLTLKAPVQVLVAQDANRIDPLYEDITVRQGEKASTALAERDNETIPLESATLVNAAYYPYIQVNENTGLIVASPSQTDPIGLKELTIHLVYTDGTEEDVPAKVTITPAVQSTKHDPQYTAVKVAQGAVGHVDKPTDKYGIDPTTTFEPTAATPAWALVNADGSIELTPGLDVATGTYTIPVRVTYFDNTSEEITAPVTVTPAADTAHYEADWDDFSVPQNQTVTVSPTKSEGFPADATFFKSGDTTLAWVEVNPTTGDITAHPDFDVKAGTYPVNVQTWYIDGSHESEEVLITVIGGDYSDIYTPTYRDTTVKETQTATVARPTDVIRNVAIPTGTTFAQEGQWPEWATLQEDGSIALAPQLGDKGDYALAVKLTYADAGQTSEIATAQVTVTDAPIALRNGAETPMYSDTTVYQGTTKTIPAPTVYTNGKTINPADIASYAAGTDVPAWVKVNPDGSLVLTPAADEKLGVVDPMPEIIVTYADGSTEPFRVPITVIKNDQDGDGLADEVDPDIDGDGVNNFDEVLVGTDPRNPMTNGNTLDGDLDTDGDGRTNGEESFIPQHKDPVSGKLVDTQVPTDAETGMGIVDEATYGDHVMAGGLTDENDNEKPDLTEADTDGDGIPDNQDPDIDGDGVNNEDEKAAGLDPYKKDTDGDGVDDGKEDTDGDGKANADESYVPAGAVEDADGDGWADITITDINPKNDNADLLDGDLDGDGLADAVDPDIDGDGVNNFDELAAGLNPRNADSDGDGTPDGEEDTDRDGRSNREESYIPKGADGKDKEVPTDAETGLGKVPADNVNIMDDSGETDRNNNGTADLIEGDTDGDGIPDSEDPDIDGDGVNNEDEKAAGLDPYKKDTDGDGIDDGAEDNDGDGISNRDESDTDGDGNPLNDGKDRVWDVTITDINGNGIADLVDANLDTTNDANYAPLQPRVGQSLTSTPTFDNPLTPARETASAPAGTTFTIDAATVPAGWTAELSDPATGAVTVSIPKDAPTGVGKEIAITVNYADGSSEEALLLVTPAAAQIATETTFSIEKCFENSEDWYTNPLTYLVPLGIIGLLTQVQLPLPENVRQMLGQTGPQGPDLTPQFIKDINAQFAKSGVQINVGGIVTILGLLAAAALVGAYYLSKCTSGTGWDFSAIEGGASGALSSDAQPEKVGEQKTNVDTGETVSKEGVTSEEELTNPPAE